MSDRNVLREYVDFMTNIEKVENELAQLQNASTRVNGVIAQHKLINKPVPDILINESKRINEIRANYINSLVGIKNITNEKFNISYDGLTEYEIEEVKKYEEKINLFFDDLASKFNIKF